MAHRMNAMTRLALSLGWRLAAVGPVAGHPRVLWPNGGEVLEAGSTVTITWRIDIQHSTLNWDLWYSATGPRGPWIVIEMDLPPGSTAVGRMPMPRTLGCPTLPRVTNGATIWSA